jgi:hypothetical protein
MIKDFIIKTLAYSTKRIISVFTAILLGVCVIASLFGVIVPDSILIALVTVITGHSTMTLFQKDKSSENSVTAQ